MKSDHQLHEKRSLRLHRLVVDRFQEDPSDVIQCGLQNLKRWRSQGGECDDWTIWEEILLHSPDRIPQILRSKSQEATRLRQSSPFAGLISECDRRRILATTK